MKFCVAAGLDPLAEVLRDRLKAQFESERTEIRVRAGLPAEQLRNELAENFYDLAVLGALNRLAAGAPRV